LTILTSNISAILLAGSAKDNFLFDPNIFTLVLSVVSIFLFALLFVFLRKRVVQTIRERYIAMVYGRYSFEFLTFFKENNIRSPYNGCIKDEITMHLMVFFRKIKNSQEFQTNTTIDYGQIPFMTNSKNLFKIKGKPDCMKVAAFNDLKFMVIGYGETLQGLRMKSMFFFLNDRFIMGEFLFSDLLRLKPANMAGTLSSKYLNGASIEKEVFYITDSTGNMLNYENNGFSISIKYLFNGDDTTNKILTELFFAGTTQSEIYVNAFRNEELLDRF